MSILNRVVGLIVLYIMSINAAAHEVESLQQLSASAVLKNKVFANSVMQGEDVPVCIKDILNERQNWLNEKLVSASYFAVRYAHLIVHLLDQGADPAYGNGQALHTISQAPCGYGTQRLFCEQEKKDRISSVIQAFVKAGATVTNSEAIIQTYQTLQTDL